LGWFCTLGWFACSVAALRLQVDHPLVQPELITDSVEYLKVRMEQAVHDVAELIFVARSCLLRLTSSTSGFTSPKLL
jgi:hypothetical protein